ncbi:MAG: SpoIID/LytB domain-containing protein [Christensenellales bacterium]
MKIRIALSSAENYEAYDVGEGQEIELDVEEYLKGVVAAEMGDGSLEALKAQAVASRTLAARYEERQSPIKAQSIRRSAPRVWTGKSLSSGREHRRRGSYYSGSCSTQLLSPRRTAAKRSQARNGGAANVHI